MRADMKQVLIERPRGGWRVKRHRHNKPRVADWIDGDGFIERDPPRLRKTKHFSDLLSPLRKYLHGQVGRPWDKIYSEIVATIDNRSMCGRHLLDHLHDEVQVHCDLDADGLPLYPAHSHRRHQELYGLYVHPRHRLLCERTRPARARNRSKTDECGQGSSVLRPLNDQEYLVKRQGIWFQAQMRPVRFKTKHRLVPGDRIDFRLRPGSEFMILKARQLSTRELRTLKLANSPAD